eukprot:1036451-Ditylum_brightwellii.AAC.1
MGGGGPCSSTEQDEDKASTGYNRYPPLLLMYCGPNSSCSIEHDNVITSHINRSNRGGMSPAA